jgi:hypothetical protein
MPLSEQPTDLNAPQQLAQAVEFASPCGGMTVSGLRRRTVKGWDNVCVRRIAFRNVRARQEGLEPDQSWPTVDKTGRITNIPGALVARHWFWFAGWAVKGSSSKKLKQAKQAKSAELKQAKQKLLRPVQRYVSFGEHPKNPP